MKKLAAGCVIMTAALSTALTLGCQLSLPLDKENESPDGGGEPEIDARAQKDAQDGSEPDALVEPDSGPEPVVDHSDQLPNGVAPPMLWFWRGIHQDNLSWFTDDTGRSCAHGDTTMWFHCTENQQDGCRGAPACDPDHFATEERTCMGNCCCWRNWDDPRGPEFRVSENTGPVEIHNRGAKGLNGDVPEYGFGVTICALPGTVAKIDTCPRSDVYSCVQDRYPQFVDDCTTVLLTVSAPPAQYPADLAGCYSTKADVTIRF